MKKKRQELTSINAIPGTTIPAVVQRSANTTPGKPVPAIPRPENTTIAPEQTAPAPTSYPTPAVGASGEREPDAPSPAKKRGLSRKLHILGRLLLKLVVMLVYAALFAAVIFGILLHYKNDTTTYEKTFYTIQTSRVESNIRIVLLSDLHLNQFGPNNDTLVQDIAKLNPDMIAIVGDMNCQDDPDVSVVLSLCERLTEIAPTYYSYGNHEVAAAGQRGDTLKTELEARGVIVTNKRIYRANINGNEVAICGLDYDTEHYVEGTYVKKIVDQFLQIDDAYTILLAHYPDFFVEGGMLYYCGADLVLCGHAHGGQARVPLVGGLYSNGQGFLPELTEGVHNIYGGGKVVVSRGLGDGNDKPPRINNPYELVVLDVNWY